MLVLLRAACASIISRIFATNLWIYTYVSMCRSLSFTRRVHYTLTIAYILRRFAKTRGILHETPEHSILRIRFLFQARDPLLELCTAFMTRFVCRTRLRRYMKRHTSGTDTLGRSTSDRTLVAQTLIAIQSSLRLWKSP
ncbi:hypothetical protein K438DRAFT_1819778 [Mycena galopus ATCC 62051]|nr:hypothetical protein K438DRAFT_1819778 [Mycena galopus ATCC 62051]